MNNVVVEQWPTYITVGQFAEHILLGHHTWPPYLATILGHHTWPYVATILGHHGRKTRITVTNHLDTVSTVDPTNIMSHLISWMSNYAEPKPTLKTQATYFPGGPLPTQPTKHPISCPSTTLSTLPKPSVLRLLPRSVWLFARKTPWGRCETIWDRYKAIKWFNPQKITFKSIILQVGRHLT